MGRQRGHCGSFHWAIAAAACSFAAATTEQPTAKDWLKGTTWRWNNWRDVTFECTGRFSAPTADCEAGGCRWSVDGDSIIIDWGDAGRHTLRHRSRGHAGAGAQRGSVLDGHRDRDSDPCQAVFVSTADCPVDWYEVLGVETDASTRDIKKKYRQLSMELHPDKPGGDATKFAQVAEAYETLGDVDSRALYDKQTGRGNGAVRFYQEEQSVVAPMDARKFNSKSSDALHIVDFYAPWCGHCQELAPQYRRAALAFDDDGHEPKVQFYAVNCDEQRRMCGELGIRGYPSVRAYFPKEDIDGEVFDGEHTPEAIEAWVSSLRAPAATVKLGRNNFHARVLGPSAGLWVVDFSAGSWCGPCTSLKQQLRKVAAKLDGVASVGIVDCDRNQGFCADMGIGAYPALRWFGGGEPKNGGALPEYNIQQSTVLEIWSEGVLAAAATARGTRRRAGQTRRTDGNTGGGDRTGAESEEAIDWGDFEEAEMAQERADKKRWRAEDSIDESAYGRGHDTSETEVIIVAAGLAVAVVLVFVWVMGEDDRSEEQVRPNRPYNQQQQQQQQQQQHHRTPSERTQVATEARGGNPALPRGMARQVAESGDNAVRKRVTVGNGVGAQAAAATDGKTD